MRSDLMERIAALADAAEAGGEAAVSRLLWLVVLAMGEQTDAVLLAEVQALLATVPALRRHQPPPRVTSA